MHRLEGNFSLADLQQYIRAKDYKPELAQAYFLKLVEEVGELAEALRKGSRLDGARQIKGTVEEELYDVLYYVLGLANVYDIDMEEACRLKEELNRERYQDAGK